MRKWITLLFILMCAVGYSQQVPIRVIRADTTNGLIIMTQDSVLRYYSTDSLPGVSPQDLSMAVDSIKITDGDGIPLSQFAALFQAYVLANEGKAYDIVEKILSIGGGLTISYTNPGTDTDNHDIEISAVDQSASNEFQAIDQFDIVANQLGLSLQNDGVPASSVDLSPYLDNTDAQTMTIDSNGNRVFSLALSGGNTIYWKDSVGSGSDGVTTAGTHDQINDELDFTVNGASDFSVDISTLPKFASLNLSIDSTGNRVFTLDIAGANSVSWKDSIGGGGGTDDQNLDIGTFSSGTGDLTIGIEDGTDQTINLDGRYLISEVDGSTTNELQDIDVAQLSGTDLELSLSSDPTTHVVDLSSLQDGTGTDDQNIQGSSFNSGSGELTIGIESGTSEVVDLDGRYLTSEVDGSISNELQDLDIAQLSGTDLELSLTQDATTHTIDLSTLQDGTGTDDQNIQGGSWNFTNGELTIGIESGSSQTIDIDGRYLISEVDGSTSNELQDFDIAQLSGTDLELSLTQDATTHTVDLSSLSGASDGVTTAGTHDQINQEIDFTVAAPGSNFSVDVSTLASLAALIDTAADIRADFPSGGSGTVKGTGVANRLAYWASSDSLANDADMSFNGTKATFGDLQTNDGVDFSTTGTIWRSGNDIRYKANASSGFHLFYDDSDALMFHLYNLDGSGRFYNNLGIGGNPGSYRLATYSGDIYHSGRLGINGRTPNASYAIHANGHAIFYSGSDYAYLRSNGELQLAAASTRYDIKSSGGDFVISNPTLGNILYFDYSEDDVRIYGDMEIDDHLAVNNSANSSYTFRVTGNGNTSTTTNTYIESSSDKLLEIRDDGGVEGEVRNWLHPMVAGVVPNSYGYGDYAADPQENNALFRATDRFTVSATNTTTSNYYYWFDNGYSIDGCNVNASSTAVVSIDLTDKGLLPANGLTYTQGKIVVVTHAAHDLGATSSGRWKDKDGVWTAMTYNGVVFDNGETVNFGSEFEMYEFEIAADNYMTDIELSLVNDNAFALRVRAIMWFPYRAGGQIDPVSFQKYSDQNMTRALIFRNDDYDQELLIDPQSSTVMTATGQVRFNNNVLDADGDSGTTQQIYGKSESAVNETDWRDFHDYFTFYKMDNSASSTNLNTVGWTDVTDIDTEALEYGDSTVFSLNSGDLRCETQAVIELKAVMQLTSLDTANLDIAFFKNGSQITGGMTYSVHFVGATTCTVVMNETVLASADDDFDIRSRRRGSATGTVTITATESAYLEAELKRRGN